MKKFEYMVVSFLSFNEKKVVDKLNEYGKEGWELVDVEGAYHYFKRAIE